MPGSDTIITFDLHEVVFTFDYTKIAKILLKSKSKLALFSILFRPVFLWKFFKLGWQSGSDEEFFDLISNLHPGIFNLAVDVTNAQKVMPGMGQLLRDLVYSGYELHVCSNIGERRFATLSSDFPDIFKYFSKIKIVKLVNGHYLRKPDLRFFNDYLQQNVPDGRRSIFIDDKKRNLTAAESVGMIPVRFKSAHNLKNALKNLGVNVKKALQLGKS